MPFESSCARCGTTVRIAAEEAGQSRLCPKCVVPLPPATYVETSDAPQPPRLPRESQRPLESPQRENLPRENLPRREDLARENLPPRERRPPRERFIERPAPQYQSRRISPALFLMLTGGAIALGGAALALILVFVPDNPGVPRNKGPMDARDKIPWERKMDFDKGWDRFKDKEKEKPFFFKDKEKVEVVPEAPRIRAERGSLLRMC